MSQSQNVQNPMLRQNMIRISLSEDVARAIFELYAKIYSVIFASAEYFARLFNDIEFVEKSRVVKLLMGMHTLDTEVMSELFGIEMQWRDTDMDGQALTIWIPSPTSRTFLNVEKMIETAADAIDDAIIASAGIVKMAKLLIATFK
jgi:hypothetical protein